MVAVYMAEKACKWRWSGWVLAEVVDWLFSVIQTVYMTVELTLNIREF